METKEVYISDGVYASFDGYGIELSTQREHNKDTIYLKPAVLVTIIEFAKSLGLLK